MKRKCKSGGVNVQAGVNVKAEVDVQADVLTSFEHQKGGPWPRSPPLA